MTKITYMAYGSNLHPYRLQMRVPSARLIGIAPVPGMKLEFSKRGDDGSGKCTMVKAADSAVYVALFAIDNNGLRILDQVEGTGYQRQELRLRFEGKTIEALTYVASASHVAKRIESRLTSVRDFSLNRQAMPTVCVSRPRFWRMRSRRSETDTGLFRRRANPKLPNRASLRADAQRAWREIL